MSLNDLGLIDCEEEEELTLLIDGDIVVFRLAAVFTDDDDQARAMIQRTAKKQIAEMMIQAGCSKYRFLLSPKSNFRDELVSDYKANRADLERPINLVWAKQMAMSNLGGEFVHKLEADDLMGIYSGDDTVIWSPDKDLRQIAGKHLCDSTRKVIEITKEGKVESRGSKVYFEGEIGFLYQLLVGDSADYIIGCGKRVPAVYKSGAKKGQEYTRRVGIGPKAAVKILNEAGDTLKEKKQAVVDAYIDMFLDTDCRIRTDVHPIMMMTIQARLLHMIRDMDGDWIKMWSLSPHHGESYNLKTGEWRHD